MSITTTTDGSRSSSPERKYKERYENEQRGIEEQMKIASLMTKVTTIECDLLGGD